jgi:ABC-2 type transport system permease protein
VSTVERETGRFGATLTLAIAIFKKQLILMLRYPINLLSGLLTMYVFFALIFFGGQAVAGDAITDNLEGLIIGFFLWSMAWSAFADLTWDLTREAQWGTLEQLYMTVHGFEVVMTIKSAVNILLSFLTGALILVLMMLTTGETVIVDVVTIVPVIALGLWSVVGLGFVFGGLAIIYKRIERVFQIFSFGLIALISAPVDAVPALKALPLAQSSYLLQRAMEDGERLWEFAPAELGALVAVAVAYSLLGAIFFRFAQRRARKLGVMGHY